MWVGFKLYVDLVLVCMGWVSRCKSSTHNSPCREKAGPHLVPRFQ